MRLWGFHCVRADFVAADRVAQQLLDLADDSTPDGAAFAVGGHWAVGMTAFHQGLLAEACEHLDKALAMADSLPAIDVGWTAVYNLNPRCGDPSVPGLLVSASG